MQPTPELTRDNMRMRTDDAPPGSPAGHRLLIKVVAEEERTQGGIIIPAKDKTACEYAKVLAVGRNAFMGYGEDDPWCQAGDMVYFVRHSGKPLELIDDPEKYSVINDEDVYFVCDSSEVDDG